MSKPKIFIASSGRTLELARQLRAQLNPNRCEGALWTEVSQLALGKSIFTMLKEAADEYDFAVIILAKDDVMITEEGEKLKARDNCIFEAGLFMGELGQERCFLLSGVPSANLPSDLGGLIYLPFTEPPDLNDPEACRRAMATATTRIEGAVWKLNAVDRPLSHEKLQERERSTAEGGELLPDQVVVSSVQPLALDISYDAARQVRMNIDRGIQYIYFFHGDDFGVSKTCQLLQMVLLANILKSQAEADDFRGRAEKIKSNILAIKQDLERICEYEMIKIYFLSSPPALQYIIHNAGDQMNAKIYLKHNDKYIEWQNGPEAHQFWAEMRKMRGALNPKPEYAIYYGEPEFNMKEGYFVNALKRSARLYFSDMEEDLTRLCLNGITKINAV